MTPSRLTNADLIAVCVLLLSIPACYPSRDISRPSKAIMGCWFGPGGSLHPYMFNDKIFTFKSVRATNSRYSMAHVPYRIIQETLNPFQVILEIPSSSGGTVRYTYRFSADRKVMTCIQGLDSSTGKNSVGPSPLIYQCYVTGLD